MSRCRVEARESFNRDLRKLDETTVRRILEKLKQLEENPYLGKPLKDPLEKLYRIAVGKYRILYYPRPCRVTLVKVGHRESVYAP